MTTLVVREATEPPEARGITRDAVRMLVAYGNDDRLAHAHAHDLPQFLDEGDLVALNLTEFCEAMRVCLGKRGAVASTGRNFS